jgi:tRNA pseudouridine65 synthase
MLEILWQDELLVAINKPSGLLVHRSAIDRYETRFAMQLLRDQLGQHVWPLHRLDKPTSGVLLFGLSAEAARLMATQFEQHTIRKSYLAIVRGYTVEQAVIDYPLKEIHDKMTDKLAD